MGQTLEVGDWVIHGLTRSRPESVGQITEIERNDEWPYDMAKLSNGRSKHTRYNVEFLIKITEEEAMLWKLKN